jgi:alanine dehydrogenase
MRRREVAMIVGLPKEVKDKEYRVAMTPGGVQQLVGAGHRVLVQSGAGAGSGFEDDEYERAGGVCLPTAEEVWHADLVVKVKEPQPQEYAFLRPGLALFTFLHLAADRALTLEMMERGVTGIAYETVERPDGSLPLLTPMSEVAGRMAVQVGAQYLEKTHGGRGKLLGGVPGVRPADVTIIGAGVVGTQAAQTALGLGAHVMILDVNVDRLRFLEQVLAGRLTTLTANPINIAEAVKRADLLIGAVLIKGATAPRLVAREMVRSMEAGSVIVDVSVDQGGCIETTRPATHSKPIHVDEGVIHYGVTNMPGAVPRTSTYALSNATMPYVMKLADGGILEVCKRDPDLEKGVNVHGGRITYGAVADAFGLASVALQDLGPHG